ncbi:hypothetical protein LXL04_006871 [Taraxacum kok-saghyz]
MTTCKPPMYLISATSKPSRLKREGKLQRISKFFVSPTREQEYGNGACSPEPEEGQQPEGALKGPEFRRRTSRHPLSPIPLVKSSLHYITGLVGMNVIFNMSKCYCTVLCVLMLLGSEFVHVHGRCLKCKRCRRCLENMEKLKSGEKMTSIKVGTMKVVIGEDFRPTAPGHSPGAGHDIHN